MSEQNGPKYPDIRIRLIGEDGNAFYVIGKCLNAMQDNKLPKEEIQAFKKEAMSGDYDNLLGTVMKWFDVI